MNQACSQGKHIKTSGAKHPKISQGSDNYVGGSGILVQKKSDGEPGHLVQNADIRGKQATDFSSREPSSTDDDDYGEVEILGFMIPDVEKVRKRKESNRESARRSRNRKAAHMKDLEDQVAQLRVENSSLLRRLAALNQKYNDATVDNRVLKADIETLKAQVKMAAEAVKRFTGMSPLPAKPVSDMPSHGIIFHGSASDANNDASAPIQDYFATTTDHRVNNSSMPNLTPCFQGENAINGRLTASRKINRIASQHAMALEDLNKAMCGMPTSPGSAPWSWASLDPNEFVNMEMH